MCGNRSILYTFGKKRTISWWEQITYPFPNFNGCAVEVWELISNFVSHFIMDAITYSCWYSSWTMLVNGDPEAHKRQRTNGYLFHFKMGTMVSLCICCAETPMWCNCITRLACNVNITSRKVGGQGHCVHVKMIKLVKGSTNNFIAVNHEYYSTNSTEHQSA